MSETTLIPDNEEWDCTDFAHPAWWRGNDHGFASCVQRVNQILDGKDTDTKGVSNMPQLDKLRKRLIKIVMGMEELAEMPVADMTYSDFMRMYSKAYYDFTNNETYTPYEKVPEFPLDVFKNDSVKKESSEYTNQWGKDYR